MTQRNSLFSKKNQRIEPFSTTWFEELNFFEKKNDSDNWTFQCNSKNWTLCQKKIQRIELFFKKKKEVWLKILNFSLKYNSKK